MSEERKSQEKEGKKKKQYFLIRNERLQIENSFLRISKRSILRTRKRGEEELRILFDSTIHAD